MIEIILYINPSHPDPGRGEKSNLKRFYQDIKGLHKAWGTIKKCEKENLS